jgi:hypothetical protein
VREVQQKKRVLIMKKMQKDPDMLEEYNFSNGVQGKYAKEFKKGSNIVVLEPGVAEFFPDTESVNQTLRSLIKIIKRQKTDVPHKKQA